MSDFLIVALAVWFGAAWVLFLTAGADGTLKSHQIIWWPLELVKLLFRTLWRSLASGWQP